MPGNQSSIKPESASVSSASDEESHLELYLQKQLEEDIARIFDESIYSDLEVVCGKLKILTHSCILKARTHTFYKKLETILHVKIDRDTFDEIYSFISDAYTECNINHQEKEIITYLNANIVEFAENNKTANDEPGETEVFLTPKCVVSPFEEKNVQKSISSSPSTELTKEYYALVPIDNNLLEKELKEQDALSNAFQTIIKSQTEFRTQTNVANLIKPTTLFLNSSHSSKTFKHSSSCDSLRRTDLKDIINIHIKDFVNENSTKAIASHDDKTPKVESITDFNPDAKQYISEINAEKNTESGFSPDSLLTDDPSSVSDYISAAYTFSPGAASSSYLHQLNVGDHNTKMENVLSDSGCENTRIMESLSSHKDVTVTDISLTESTLHDLALDEAGYSHEYIQNPLEDKNKSNLQTTMSNSNSLPGILLEKNEITSKPTCFKEVSSCSASKEEKQRQNEEIVIMESSSVSSETGSWESVFPPKFDDKEICQSFLLHEHQFSKGFTVTNVRETNNSNTRAHNVRPDALESFEVNKPYKSTSCFIDAASLSEDDVPIPNIALDKTIQPNNTHALPVPFIPVACSSVKLDMSPNEWSESNENDDSLEQPENKGQHKDLSPTIFEMTPEDSLSVQNSDEILVSTIMGKASTENIKSTDKFREPSTVAPNPPFTPYNSILSLMDTSLKTYESDGSESNMTLIGHTNQVRLDFKENNKSVSSTSSAIFSKDDEEYNSEAYFSSGSYSTNRQLDDMPVVFGRCEIKEDKQKKIPKNSCAPVWVVDMKPDSVTTQSDEKNPEQVKNTSKAYYNIDNNSNKSRSSVDSESSDRSSQKFFIDLTSLPDPLPTEKQVDKESINEKKNMFSMFIDLGEKSSVKEMPARLSSSLTNKKSNNVSSKNSSNNTKEVKPALNSNEHDEVKCSLITFEKLESLCNDPSFSISEIIGISETITTQDKSDDDIQPKQQNEKTFATHIVTNTIKEEDEPRHGHEAEFVKLSDLDKPSLISDISVNEYTTIDVRMTRSIPDRNWGEQSVSSRSIGFFSPYHSENALSLNRLFPHLKNEFSKSMPGSLSLRTKSPMRQGNGEIEDQVSDVSESSSIQSSFCRSIVGNSTTEDTSQTSSLINNCQSRLGQDLLRMFLEEIAPDVTVEVAGKRIKAHKCILSSRCQYFAGILSGGWVQSAGNVIVLPTFSYNVVHFAMCHIYSGISAIPDSVSILELATLADMLGLEGLKEAIMFTLKAKYCHHFHRPCTLCIAGVLECFPLSSAYGLDDLYRKCLKWITKYFFKVWPTKAFATLPYELLDKCYQQHVVNLSTENLIDTVYGCGIILASLQNIKWSEIVERLCRRLVNAAGHFVAAHLSEMVQVAATRVEEAPSTARQALLDCFAAAIEWAPPDEACRTYAYLSAIIKQKKQSNSKPELNADVGQGNNMPASLLFAHATLWRLQCESALVRSAPRVVTTQAFQELSPDLRKRLRELGCIMYGAPSAKSMPALGHERKTKINSNKNSRSDITSVNYNLAELVRSTFVPYSSKPLTQSASIDVMKSNNDIRDNKKMNQTHPPQIKTTKAQEERAKFNLAKTKQMEKQNRQPAVVRGASSFKNTKPRYLEPKANKEVNKKTVEKKNGVKVISSSESSRYSSSVQLGTVRANRWGAQGSRACVAHAHSPDSLATSSRPRTAEPSTDSLSESQNNKYGTYTKAKHPTKAPVENVKSLKTQSGDQKMLNIKGKSKLPIHLRHSAPQKCFSGKPTTGDSKSKAPSVAKERPTGSLMNATKSSSAKIAHKLVKEPQAKSHKERKSQTKASTSRAMSAPKDSVVPHEPLMMGGSTYRDAVVAYENSTMNAPREDENTFEIPAMERSGTFLKDEPTFGNKSWWGEWGGPSGL